MTKQKICVHCRHYFNAARAATAMAAKQADALQRSMEAGRRHKAAVAEAEARRAKAVDETGDPLYGYDRTDPARRRLDAALDACLRLSWEPRRACLGRLAPPTVAVPDPASLDGGTLQVRVPSAESDPRGLDADPRETADPPREASALGGMPAADVQAALAPPYAPSVLLEEAGAAQRPRVIKVPVDAAVAAAAAKGAVSVGGHYPSSPDGHEVVLLSELSLCVNVASRELAVSLFRGVVGREGDVECVDDPLPPATA